MFAFEARWGRRFGGILLIASVAVGAGMLALPIAIGLAGFGPAMVTLGLCFLYMTYCLFLVLEANLVAPPGSHLVGMIRRTLGPWWCALAWLNYLLLLYAALAAYMSAGGGVVAQWLNGTPWSVSPQVGLGILVSITLVLVYSGTHAVDYFNRVLTIGMVCAFGMLVVWVLPHADVHNLQHHHITMVWAALPVVLLSFTSHIIVPSLRVYFDSDVSDLKWVLCCGSLLPLCMYAVWQVTVLGILPVEGAHGLIEVTHSPHQVATMVAFLGHYLHQNSLMRVVAGFSFFALATSLLAASLSLWHFIEDGLTLTQYRYGHLWRLCLTFLPPVLFACYDPHGFTVALSYAGVFVAVLFCLLPALIVWKSRYVLCEARPFRCWGGRPALVLVVIMALGVMLVQILARLGILPGL